MELDYSTMAEAGVHFGHQRKRWNPKFKTYLYKHVHGISIINLEKTGACLEAACKFLSETVKNGGKIMFVGTKKQAQEVVRTVAKAVEMPFCSNRWLGGCLTNFGTVRASLNKYKKFLRMDESGELAKLPKKEGAAIRREMARMARSFEGIRDIEAKPEAIVVVDSNYEDIAIKEAKRLQIPVVAIVDTNSDPTVVNFPIPANDDSVKSLQVIFEEIQKAIEQGIELHKMNKSGKDIPNVNVAQWEQPIAKDNKKPSKQETEAQLF